MADEPSADELVEELRRAKVSDLLVQTLSMVASMGFAKLAPGGARPRAGQARDRGAEGARSRARGPVAEAILRDFDQVLANLQLAYADAVKADAAT